MILDMLKSTSDAGARFLPTDRNVRVLLQLGMTYSQNGEPTLVALDNGVIVGFTIWGSGEPPFDLSEDICQGFGTYVVPNLRRKRVASALRLYAMDVARNKGYSVIEGTAYDAQGEQSALAVGFVPVGTQLECRL